MLTYCSNSKWPTILLHISSSITFLFPIFYTCPSGEIVDWDIISKKMALFLTLSFSIAFDLVALITHKRNCLFDPLFILKINVTANNLGIVLLFFGDLNVRSADLFIGTLTIVILYAKMICIFIQSNFKFI